MLVVGYRDTVLIEGNLARRVGRGKDWKVPAAIGGRVQGLLMGCPLALIFIPSNHAVAKKVGVP